MTSMKEEASGFYKFKIVKILAILVSNTELSSNIYQLKLHNSLQQMYVRPLHHNNTFTFVKAERSIKYR